MTTEGLGRCIEECRDHQFQSLMLEDTQDMLWQEDCSRPEQDYERTFERDELEYFSSAFGMADVLDMTWSACANGLN